MGFSPIFFLSRRCDGNGARWNSTKYFFTQRGKRSAKPQKSINNNNDAEHAHTHTPKFDHEMNSFRVTLSSLFAIRKLPTIHKQFFCCVVFWLEKFCLLWGCVWWLLQPNLVCVSISKWCTVYISNVCHPIPPPLPRSLRSYWKKSNKKRGEEAWKKNGNGQKFCLCEIVFLVLVDVCFCMARLLELPQFYFSHPSKTILRSYDERMHEASYPDDNMTHNAFKPFCCQFITRNRFGATCSPIPSRAERHFFPYFLWKLHIFLFCSSVYYSVNCHLKQTKIFFHTRGNSTNAKRTNRKYYKITYIYTNFSIFCNG